LPYIAVAGYKKFTGPGDLARESVTNNYTINALFDFKLSLNISGLSEIEVWFYVLRRINMLV
jgi:hypothetical protein